MPTATLSMMATANPPITQMKTVNWSVRLSMSWGPSPEYADWWYAFSWKGLIWSAGIAAAAACAIAIFTMLQFWSDGIRDSKSDSRIAELNSEAEKLKGDNLALQTVLLPRKVGLIVINEPTPAQRAVAEEFANLSRFAGTEISIQVAANDSEAQNLATEIAIMLSRCGWHPRFIDEAISEVTHVSDGIQVLYPTGKSWTAAEPNQPWFAWMNAAELLANVLTKAGLGIGAMPVSRGGFVNTKPVFEFAIGARLPGVAPFFNPPLEGVYLLVGSRPVSLTVAWIKAGRPNPDGTLPGPATAPGGATKK